MYTSPETACTFESRATEPTCTSPETVLTSSEPPTVSTCTSPLADLKTASAQLSTCASPDAVLKSTIEYSPRASRSADFVFASMLEPWGHEIRSCIDGVPSWMFGPPEKE